jgi:hypothetical protein
MESWILCSVDSLDPKMIETSLIRIEKSPFSRLGKGKTRLGNLKLTNKNYICSYISLWAYLEKIYER